MDYLTPITKYFLDSRDATFPGHPGLPDQKTSSDPYLNELLDLYPHDIYPGGRYFELPSGRTKAWKFGNGHKGRVLLIAGFSMPSVSEVFKPPSRMKWTNFT